MHCQSCIHNGHAWKPNGSCLFCFKRRDRPAYKALAGAWAAEGIRVNAIAPGFIRTELTRPIAEDAARFDGTINRTPQRRWGEPADVAGAAVFLCSNAANFITGTVLTVDGGYTAV
jgi:NAD(P)-dependent dehydrogenase (short-subunit alcohol dehydrogenase family)